MAKLMHCAPKCGQSTPNRVAVSWAIWPRSLPMLPNKMGDCIILSGKGQARSRSGPAPWHYFTRKMA